MGWDFRNGYKRVFIVDTYIQREEVRGRSNITTVRVDGLHFAFNKGSPSYELLSRGQYVRKVGYPTA